MLRGRAAMDNSVPLLSYLLSPLFLYMGRVKYGEETINECYIPKIIQTQKAKRDNPITSSTNGLVDRAGFYMTNNTILYLIDT